jgi:hypothetical protein
MPLIFGISNSISSILIAQERYFPEAGGETNALLSPAINIGSGEDHNCYR